MKIELIGSVRYSIKQRDRFRSGELVEEWTRLFPEIFDADDLRIAKNQPDYHFFEWLGAIVLHATTGYLSLVEKYEFANHDRKNKIIKDIVEPAVLEWIHKQGVQCPDLFVYSSDQSDWYFCEVKGNQDRIRPEQEAYFEQLGQVCGKPETRLLLYHDPEIQLV